MFVCMKNVWIAVAIVIILALAGWWYLAADRSAAPATPTPTPSEDSQPATTADLNTLLRENAQLMVQAGVQGIDARKRDEWKAKAQEASRLLSERRTDEAAEVLVELNAEIRGEIE